MLKQISALVLLVATLATTFSKTVIVVDFYAHQDYIAKNLCENRDKPMMHCCGRCMLRKRLNRQADQDKNNPERRSENKQDVLFLEDGAIGLQAPARRCVDLPYPSYIAADPIDRAAGIFHPPA